MILRLFAVGTILGAVFPVLAVAESTGGQGGLPVSPIRADSLKGLRWTARPVVVLGQGHAVRAQLAALQEEAAALRERDVVLLTDGPGATALRPRLGDGFAVLLIGKDGGIKLSRSAPVDPAEIIGLIDAMPMRRREAMQDE
ncbi:DUF4174 domain-containing protein [Paracoccus salsus]|uniref:DUF4174 domain-containing protein n=1 Tax=Paracoccus salsus TaxID=2911061 RepID=UPI001F32D613|nr:DUF4174 domain-containing protein [Paracoccus salsus]MCF3974638.1 DUF4174 domain-containing protein [Paracoccus salsus]